MPLFMDLHKADDYDVKPTIEEIKRNHIADLKTQAKYGVRFIQYWVNEDAGLVFCLMEGPNKEACVATHQEAHGNMACNVIELKGGDYRLFMGEGKVNEFDITEDLRGVLDPGTRTFLVVDVISFSDNLDPIASVKAVVQRFTGREVDLKNARIKFVFNSPSLAIDCAFELSHQFRKMNDKRVEIRIAVNSGEPVTKYTNIFAEAIQLTDWLCDITVPSQVTISSRALNCSGRRMTESGINLNIRLLTSPEETFLRSLMTTLQPLMSNEEISIETLSKVIGISQAQFYRKVKGLTNYSPNSFIQEIRLRNSVNLLNQKFGNVAQIAFASGFNSPSYFTKSFKKRFGISPTRSKEIQ